MKMVYRKGLGFIVVFTISLVSSLSWGVPYKGLVERDGLYFEKFSDIPYTGDYSGPLKLETGSFVNGKKHGLWVRYYQNGQLRYKGEYLDGKRSGNWVFRYETGDLMFEGGFMEGIKEGIWKYFTEEGRLFREGKYNDGKKEGVWITYTKTGELYPLMTGIYSQGVKISD